MYNCVSEDRTERLNNVAVHIDLTVKEFAVFVVSTPDYALIIIIYKYYYFFNVFLVEILFSLYFFTGYLRVCLPTLVRFNEIYWETLTMYVPASLGILSK